MESLIIDLSQTPKDKILTRMSNPNYVAYRSLLLSNIENMLENLVARRQHNNNASQDLFGDMDDGNLIKIQLKPDTLNLSQLEIAQKEKESLGVYMHGNPLVEYEELIKQLNTIIKGRSIYLVIVQKIRKVFTKAHTLMYALELTTIDGDYEGVIYSKNASLYTTILEEKSLYWATGNINDPAKKQAAKEAKIAKEAKESDYEQETEYDPDNPTPQQLETATEYIESPKIIIDHLELYSAGVDKFLAGITIRPPETAVLEWSKQIDWSQNPEAITQEIQAKTPKELLKAKTTKYPTKSKTNYQSEDEYVPEEDTFIPTDYDEPALDYNPDINDQYSGGSYDVVGVILRSTTDPAKVKNVKHQLQKQNPANSMDYYRVNISVDKNGVIQQAKNDFYILRRDYEALGAEFR